MAKLVSLGEVSQVSENLGGSGILCERMLEGRGPNPG